LASDKESKCAPREEQVLEFVTVKDVSACLLSLMQTAGYSHSFQINLCLCL